MTSKKHTPGILFFLLIGIFIISGSLYQPVSAFVKNNSKSTSNQIPTIVIGKLQTSSKIAAIHLAGSTTLYSVSDLDGKTIDEEITISQLKQRHPQLAKNLEYGLAANDAMLFFPENH